MVMWARASEARSCTLVRYRILFFGKRQYGREQFSGNTQFKSRDVGAQSAKAEFYLCAQGEFAEQYQLRPYSYQGSFMLSKSGMDKSGCESNMGNAPLLADEGEFVFGRLLAAVLGDDQPGFVFAQGGQPIRLWRSSFVTVQQMAHGQTGIIFVVEIEQLARQSRAATLIKEQSQPFIYAAAPSSRLK